MCAWGEQNLFRHDSRCKIKANYYHQKYITFQFECGIQGSWNSAPMFSSYLASFVVEPDKCMIPGQHLAVERGIVLGWTTPSHWPADLDRLIQVDVSILERVRVGSAGEHGQRRRHWFWLECVTPTRYEGDVFLIQSVRLLLQSPKNNLQYRWPVQTEPRSPLSL